MVVRVPKELRLSSLSSADKGAESAGADQSAKLAFAEGYAAGQQSPQSEKADQAKNRRQIIRRLLLATFLIYITYELWSGAVKTTGGLFGRSEYVPVAEDEVSVLFGDVRGADEAKDDLSEVVSYLKDKDKYSALGGRLPKGVLLVGSPGTGKTLLARAVAGEAQVPFFHASGSEFDEMLVGQGARRVRELFAAAKARAPCVVFIDEIDSIGSKRVTSNLHPYANQTVNQLLTEMDGFEQNEGVVVVGATNRREDLDKALLRPGRFDIEVIIPKPDLKGRLDILNLYLAKLKTCADCDPLSLAKRTMGMTGADLENLCNQAALRAAADGHSCVNMLYLQLARDRILMGRERKAGRLPDEKTNKIVAFHEAGHTLVAMHTPGAEPIHKVTIIPRGMSLGHTAFMSEKDEYLITKQQLLAHVDTAMGGRAAEELIFGKDLITVGAGDDLRVATSVAKQMVKTFGMSEKAGVRDYEPGQGDALIVSSELGPQTAEMIDSEIRKILQESYERAVHILKTHSKEHQLLAEALLQHETLDKDEILEVIKGNPIRIGVITKGAESSQIKGPDCESEGNAVVKDSKGFIGGGGGDNKGSKPVGKVPNVVT